MFWDFYWAPALCKGKPVTLTTQEVDVQLDIKLHMWIVRNKTKHNLYSAFRYVRSLVNREATKPATMCSLVCYFQCNLYVGHLPGPRGRFLHNDWPAECVVKLFKEYKCGWLWWCCDWVLITWYWAETLNCHRTCFCPIFPLAVALQTNRTSSAGLLSKFSTASWVSTGGYQFCQ